MRECQEAKLIQLVSLKLNLQRNKANQNILNRKLKPHFHLLLDLIREKWDAEVMKQTNICPLSK